MATTTGFAVSTAFFARLARGGQHRARIAAFANAVTFGAAHLVGKAFYQLVKLFFALLAFVLQQWHGCLLLGFSPLYGFSCRAPF